MPVIAQYNLEDTVPNALDSALSNGAQDGLYMNGAISVDGQAVLDGVDDMVKIFTSDVFQMDRGTLDLTFTRGSETPAGPETVLSRDSVGETAGGYRVEVLPDGAIRITHEAPGATQVWSTPTGFSNAGDTIRLSYSWDLGGEGGQLVLINDTTPGSFIADVPNTVTMDQGAINQNWIMGAGQASSVPFTLNNIDQHFQGSVDMFRLSDDVTPPDPDNSDPLANPDTATTTEGTPVIINVLVNDTDPDGDMLTITGTPTSANGTVTVNLDGTITFDPTDGFTGPTTITYAITDGNGGTDTGTVSVNVTPDAGPTRDGIVRGTGNDDLIDRTYVDPTDGDLVDANDQILPGADVNDDIILAGDGNDTVLAGDGDDSAEGGLGDDSITGNSGNDTLLGQDGNDFIHGGRGNDSIIGGIGNDTVRGGTGDDVIDTSGNPLALPDIDYPGIYNADLNPNDDRDLVYGGRGNDAIRTGDDADTIYGGYGNDLIDAGFDADSVEAGQGNDTVTGGEGADTINAGWGDDLVYGGYGPDVPEIVNIPDANGDLRPDNNRDLILGGLGNDTIFGMDDDDTLYGGQGNDVLDGGIDDDLVRGGMGNDTILGGQGNDELHGDRGNDVLTGGAGQDTMFGEADRDDFIIGSQADGIGDTVYGGSGGDDFDRLLLEGSGPYRLTNLREDSDGNGQDGTVEFLDAEGRVTGTLNFTNIEEIVPCFTPGTLIATPKGEVPVEMLRIGDRVLTRDNGIQEIRWAGRKDLTWRDLHLASHLKPVLIRAGSLGNGLPERDMMLSPNHRVLVANDRTALYFDEHEVLVSAKHLAAARDHGVVHNDGVSYLHLMFDRHEVLLSNGAWTESFQPGDYSLKGLGNAQRLEILEIFPELQTTEGLENYQAARRVLKKHEASLLIR